MTKRKNIKRTFESKNPKLYKFIEFVDQLVKQMFSEKHCKVLQTTTKDIADHLGGLLYKEIFSDEIKEYEERFIKPFENS